MCFLCELILSTPMAVALRSINFLPCLQVWDLRVAYVKFGYLNIVILFPLIKCDHIHPKKIGKT